MRTAIIAALPGELKPLVQRGWRRVSTRQRHASKWLRVDDPDCVAVCAGMGAEAARRAFAEAESDGSLDRVFSVGWAGALNRSMAAGDVAVASSIVDAQTGERIELSGGERHMTLVSTAQVVRAVEKRRLAEAYGAVMVDMEAAAIARLARMRSIPICCIKAISDEADATLPDLNPYIDKEGQLATLSLVRHVVLRPRHWSALMRLGTQSSAAACGLASTIAAALRATSSFEQINRTGSVE